MDDEDFYLYRRPVCFGDWRTGSACRTCERCLEVEAGWRAAFGEPGPLQAIIDERRQRGVVSDPKPRRGREIDRRRCPDAALDAAAKAILGTRARGLGRAHWARRAAAAALEAFEKHGNRE